MPRFDRTGPMGQGSMTGRGFGPCGMGLGRRKGFGMGRGMGRYSDWNRSQTPTDQKRSLADYKKALEEELENVKKEEVELSKGE